MCSRSLCRLCSRFSISRFPFVFLSHQLAHTQAILPFRASPLSSTTSPPDPDKMTNIFCPNEQYNGDTFLQAGACCNDAEEEIIEALFSTVSGNLTSTCAGLYQQVCVDLSVILGSVTQNRNVLRHSHLTGTDGHKKFVPST